MSVHHGPILLRGKIEKAVSKTGNRRNKGDKDIRRDGVALASQVVIELRKKRWKT